MKKRIIFFIATLLCAIFTYSITCVLMLPNRICLMEGDKPVFSEAAAVLNMTVEPVADNIKFNADEEAVISIKALGMPVKNLNLDIFADIEVIPWGQTVGVRIDTEGVMVLGTGIVTDSKGIPHNPAEGILKSGDLIISADGVKLAYKEDLMRVAASSGDVIKLSIKRDGKQLETTIRPVTDGNNKKLGVWVRDSTQGIGTITYYNPASGKFAALGHGIMDIDTKKLMVIESGEIWPSNITDIKKGKKGTPGELVGQMNRNVILGSVKTNSTQGIYGTIEKADIIPKGGMKIGLQSRVHEGPAVIRSNISGYEIKEYDVYIESVNRNSSDSSRGMVIRITDPDLLSQTGGIVQGMSGSPIIQDNLLIGAVTHVFVQDPSKGYGIFIENMLKQEKQS